MFMTFFKNANLDFAEKVFLNIYNGDEKKHIEITDTDDLMKFKKFCKGTKAIDDGTIPSGNFGVVELIFEGKDKQVVLYPCDSCVAMRHGEEDRYYYRIKYEYGLKELLGKYGVR